MMAQERIAGLSMRWLLVVLVAMVLGFGGPAFAQAPGGDEKPADKPDWASLLGFDRPAAQARYDDERTAEGWVWARVKQDKIADLNLRCDPGGKTRLDPHDNAGWDDPCRKIPAGFVTDVLTAPRWRDRIGRHGFRLQGARIDGDMDLANADIRTEVWIDASRIDGGVDLAGAHLTGVLSFRGTRVRGDFFAHRLHADSAIGLGDHATLKGNVTLLSARVGGALDMGNSAFEGSFEAEGATIGKSLLAYNAHFAQPVNLTFTQIAGGINLAGATANLIDLTNAVIENDLTLGATASQLQWRCLGLPPADSSGDKAPSAPSWPLGDQSWHSASCASGDVPTIVLRNARIGALQDTAASWPPNLDLEGFKYDHLGGVGGTGAADMRKRSPEQWRDWLDRDRVFSTQPYTQLASVLLAAGHRDTAEAIQYFGRERERGEALARGDWSTGTWLTFLWAVAGYGIGTYTFRVLYWVGGLTVLGTLVLLTAGKARRHGLVWCFGASLQRLLPIIEFNRSFNDFFENPPPATDGEKRNLNGFQVFFFSVLALTGWVLGFVLLAAMTNLTPKG